MPIYQHGKNLLNEQYYKGATYTTGTYKYTELIDIDGTGVLYMKARLKPGKNPVSGLYLALATNGTNPNTGTTVFTIRNGATQAQGISADFTNKNPLYLSYYPTSINVEDIFDAYDLLISTNDIDYEPYVEPKIKHIEAPTSGKNLFNLTGRTIDTYTTGTTPIITNFDNRIIPGIQANSGYINNSLETHKIDNNSVTVTTKGYSYYGIGFTFELNQGDYILSFNGDSNSLATVIFYDNDGVKKGIQPLTDEHTFTVSQYKNVIITFAVNIPNTTVNYSGIQLEQGSAATTYEPYTNIDHFLPSDYQEVEYIESTGTQYIDTGITLDPGYTIETNIKFGNRTNRQLFGVNSATYYWGLNANRYLELGVSETGNTLLDDSSFYNIIVTRETSTNTASIYLDGSLEITRVASGWDANTHTIFKLKGYDIYNANASMKNYIIKNGNTLVRNFIPCYRKSDNEVGLYDTINNQFYTNQGTGSFIAGTNIVSDKIERAYATNNAGVPSQVFADRLPDELQECEYIEKNANSEYIKTGIVPSSTTEIDCYFSIIQAGAYGSLYGSVNTSDQGLAIIHGYGNNSIRPANLSSLNNISGSYPLANKTRIQQNSSGTYINNEIKNNTRGDILPVGEILIFGVNRTNTAGQVSLQFNTTFSKCYTFKILDNGYLVRNFIPCYIKPNHTFVDVNGTTQPAGTIGLYDKVNGELYVNAGTGTFTKGRDI